MRRPSQEASRAPRCPPPLRRGDRVAVCAPSSPVPEALWPRLELALQVLRERGLQVVECPSLRRPRPRSADDAQRRADELMGWLEDPSIAAVMPPWGGELAIRLLPYLDFERLAGRQPKWFSGFSDLSTLQLPLLLCAGWQSVHGPNLMELAARPLDPLTAGLWALLEAPERSELVQPAATHCQREGADWRQEPDAGLRLDQACRWRRLDGRSETLHLQGRLIGGCLDTLVCLLGSHYGDLPGWARAHAAEGVLLFLENAEQRPEAMARALSALRHAGWFDPARAVLIGRDAAASPDDAADRLALMHDVLAELGCPVLVDVDIGHVPPQFSLLQGARATMIHQPDGSAQLTVHRP